MENSDSTPYKTWENKNILAVDFGTQFTGLATFCPGRDPYPTPFGRILSKDMEFLKQELLKTIEDNSIDLVVLGVPRLTDGTETEMTRRIQNFGKKISELMAPIPLEYQDETLSSFEAEERMKNSPQYNFKIDPKHLDAVAATIILEDFMKK